MKYRISALFTLMLTLGVLYQAQTTATPPAAAQSASQKLPSKTYVSQQAATVAQVIDGDTFVTASGENVRLVGINTPERGKNGQPAQPLYHEAKQALQNLLAGQDVILKFGQKKKDKYKRLLANVYLENGTWINQKMVESGLAHVYSFPDTAGNHISHLLATESTARATQSGLWARPRWQTKNANNINSFSRNDVGQFHIIEGRIQAVADVKNRLYLNFGDDWRTDVTAEIPPKYRHAFSQNYLGKTVRFRGVIKPVNGYMITLTHPEQIEIIKQ